MIRHYPIGTRVLEWKEEREGEVVGYSEDGFDVVIRTADGTEVTAFFDDVERVGPPVATDIYERLEMQRSGKPGSVTTDLRDLTYAEMEDYFSDADPAEFL